MAGKQATDQPTSRATRLGYCLQRVVAHCLRAGGLGGEVREDIPYRDDVIRPDVLLGPEGRPRGSVHVTSSDSRESFRMKKWRYVCELFQLKRHRPGVHGVNLFWGTPEIYQPADVAFLGLLFDSTLDMRGDARAEAVYTAAKRRCVVEQPRDLARELFASAGPGLRRRIVDAARHALTAPARGANRPMWSALTTPGVNRLPAGRHTARVRLLPRTLLLTEQEMGELTASFAGRERPPAIAVELGIVEEQRAIVTRWRVEPDFRSACESGLVAAFRRAVLADERRARLVREARDPSDAAWPARLYRALRRPPGLDGACRLLRIGEGHPRLLAVDGLVAAYGVSANDLEALWDERACKTGVKNPVANLLSRTPLVAGVLAAANRDQLAAGIAHLWARLAERGGVVTKSEGEFRRALRDYRRKCLFDQKTVKAAPFAARLAFERAGWRPAGKRRYTFSSRQEGGVAVGTEFQLSFEKAGRRVLVKCLYGDTGADHKSEEMAGRLFLLPFQRSGGRVRHREVDGTPVFIPEGFWSAGQLDLLASAGWDVVGLEDLPDYLGEPAGSRLAGASRG